MHIIKKQIWLPVQVVFQNVSYNEIVLKCYQKYIFDQIKMFSYQNFQCVFLINSLRPPVMFYLTSIGFARLVRYVCWVIFSKRICVMYICVIRQILNKDRTWKNIFWGFVYFFFLELYYWIYLKARILCSKVNLFNSHSFQNKKSHLFHFFENPFKDVLNFYISKVYWNVWPFIFSLRTILFSIKTSKLLVDIPTCIIWRENMIKTIELFDFSIYSS